VNPGVTTQPAKYTVKTVSTSTPTKTYTVTTSGATAKPASKPATIPSNVASTTQPKNIGIDDITALNDF
jgi:hypothetical protein